jgi:hypothetical protein
VPIPKASGYADPIDILRRFIPTPLKAVYQFGAVQALVQTNDFSLLPPASFAASLTRNAQRDFAWVLIRDEDASGPLQLPFMLTSGPLTIVQMGPACVAGVDKERRELVAFIGSEVHARAHQEFLVPLFCRLSNEVAPNRLSTVFAQSQDNYCQ